MKKRKRRNRNKFGKCNDPAGSYRGFQAIGYFRDWLNENKHFVPLLALTLLWMMSRPDVAVALDGAGPITAANGEVDCPTCLLDTSPTQHGVMLGDGSQTLAVTNAGTTVNQVLRSGDGAAPSFGALVDADIPNDITIDLATTATTANGLAADALDAMTEIATGIKLRADDTDTHLLTTSLSIPGSNKCLEVDSNGSIVIAGSDAACAGGADTTIKGIGTFVTETTVDLAGSGTLFISLSGDLSDNEDDIQTPFANAVNLSDLSCSPNGTVGGTSLDIEFVAVTCGSGGTFNGCGSNELCVQFVTATTDSSVISDDQTLSVSAGQCVTGQLTDAGNTNALKFSCSYERTDAS